MSNNSEWQLAMRGPKIKVIELEKFLKDSLDDPARPVGERTAISVFLGNKTMVAENKISGMRAVSYGHSSTNCDKYWNNVITEVMNKARIELNILAAYARLGEDMDDYEFDDDDDGLQIEYRRYLKEVEL